MMRFSTSLKLNHIFQRLYRTNGFADGYLVLYARCNRTATNRVGITVARNWARPTSATGHAAVCGKFTA